MITKMDHSALPHPPRSSLRKMSKITDTRIQIQAIHRKSMSIVQKIPRIG
jgi:hypothetical protein